MRYLLLGPMLRWLGRLSYPRLFAVTAALFALTLVAQRCPGIRWPAADRRPGTSPALSTFA